MIKKVIVGISGASGSIYGIRTLLRLKELNYESYLVVSSSAWKVIESELDLDKDYVINLAT
ncbi:MAG: flavoprotein, partial [Thermoproteota archaeon]